MPHATMTAISCRCASWSAILFLRHGGSIPFCSTRRRLAVSDTTSHPRLRLDIARQENVSPTGASDWLCSRTDLQGLAAASLALHTACPFRRRARESWRLNAFTAPSIYTIAMPDFLLGSFRALYFCTLTFHLGVRVRRLYLGRVHEHPFFASLLCSSMLSPPPAWPCWSAARRL